MDFASSPANQKENLIIFTPNPEFLVEASRDLAFRDLLNKADINLPDGFGLILAARFLGEHIQERVGGADMVEKLLEVGNKKWEMRSGSARPPASSLAGEVGRGSESEKWVIGIVAARRGEAAEAELLIKRLSERYPNINFVNLDVIARGSLPKQSLNLNGIATSRRGGTRNDKLKIVLACHGMIKQERWIMENARPSFAKASEGTVNARVFMGVGGSLDFLTGFSKRAPIWMQQIGFEWLWRGLQRPAHFKRIWKATAVFGVMVLKEYFSSKCKVQSAKL